MFRIVILLILDLDMVVAVGDILLLEVVYNENDPVSVQIVDHHRQLLEQRLIHRILSMTMDHRQEKYIIRFQPSLHI